MSSDSRLRILVSDALEDVGIQLLQSKFDVDVRPDITADELQQVIGNYHGLIVRSRTKVTAHMIGAAKNLKVIGRAGAGLDNIDVTAARNAAIEVLNCPNANSIAVAEHTLALLLSLVRHVSEADRTMKAGKWDKKRFQGLGLTGRTLGIIGFGRIGREVAKRAAAFGMHIVVNQPRLTAEFALEQGVQARAMPLPELLETADVITLHVPMRPENVNLIGAKELARMKPFAYLINTARGGIVDEQALIEALDAGRIAGAGVDVFVEEPTTNNPLALHPKVVATPHIAASTDEAQSNAARDIAQQIIDFLAAAGDVAETLSLKVVPTGDVIPHEAFDPKRAARLATSLSADGMLANPPIVAEADGKYVVLDGATRTTAFTHLEIPHIVVQIVDPHQPDISLHTWSHLISGPSTGELLHELSRIEGLEIATITPAEALTVLYEADTLAYFALPDGSFRAARLAGEQYDRFDVLNEMVAAYTLWGEVSRTLTTDLERLHVAFPEMVALVVFPTFTPDFVLNAAIHGKTLPQGITRFVIPGRVLRLNLPLTLLQSGESLNSKRRAFDDFVRDKLGRQRVRYYHEPVVVLED
jgi:phosphoglycerate dehydrogenase-like enzyme